MTLSSYSQAWKEWSGGGAPSGWVCDAITFRFADSSILHFANKLAKIPTQDLTHETGEVATYTQLGFVLNLPQKTTTTEYHLEINMRPIANDFLRQIVNLNSQQLMQTVIVRHRTYLLPNFPNAPAITPYSEYAIGAVTTGLSSINVSCLPPNLAKKRAGVAYRVEEFSGLARF